MDRTVTTVAAGHGSGSSARPAAPRMQLVRLLDCDRPHERSGRHLLHEIDEVLLGRGDLAAVREPGPVRRLRLWIPDPRMSARHARLVRVHNRWLLEDSASKNGSILNGQTVSRAPVGDGDLFELGHTFFLLHEAAARLDAPPDLSADELQPPTPQLATFVCSLEHEYRALAAVAATGVSVLILGETGTGKEVVARALHELSGRRGELVPVNCGALPETLVTAELFGHRRGAFSGATSDRTGIIRSADGGTLFLDEIGELPPASQVALLRVLQEQQVVPVGDSRPIPVDFRLAAATHRDIPSLVESGGFRADLLGRLTGLMVTLPPLRERREDMGLLVAALLSRAPGGTRVRFEPAAMRALLRHSWPLNVRELEKCLATAVALAADGVIEQRHLTASLRRPGPPTPARLSTDSARVPAADVSVAPSTLRARLEELLAVHEGNVAAVARAMGKGRMQIHRWVRRYGIDLDAFRR